MATDGERRALDRLTLVSTLSAAIADATTVDEGLEATLKAVCEAAGWTVGQAWVPDERGAYLVCHPVWHTTQLGHHRFRAASSHERFAPGEGLVGRVWQARTVTWVDDVRADPTFRRGEAAAASLLSTALVVPVLSRGRVEALLEFCAPHQDPDPGARVAVTAAADALGALIARKRAEDALRWNERRFRAVADTATDAIITFDSTGTVVYANRGALHLLGHRREDLLGTQVTALVPPRQRERHRDEVARLLRTGDSYLLDSTTVVPALRRDGREVSVEASFATWRHEETRYFTAILRDVSERQRIRAELQRSVEAERATARRLRQVDAMRMTFLDAVSHDLRSPLAGVRAAVDVLSRQLERPDFSPAAARSFLEGIAESADKMRAMLDDLLDVERLRAGHLGLERRTADLALLVTRVVEGHRTALDGRVVSLDLEPVLAEVDAGKLERLVENLVLNAAKHTPPGTPVLLRLMAEEGHAVLTCEDRGPGVPAALRRQVFERFGRGAAHSRAVEGTGLGLSLVARLAELHGGSAWVEDRPGGGASFRVRLPLRAAGQAPDGQEGGDDGEPADHPADL